MKWNNSTKERIYLFDLFFTEEIIYDAYMEGYINWNLYQKALGKIASNKNGSWMFERGSVIINTGEIWGKNNVLQ